MSTRGNKADVIRALPYYEMGYGGFGWVALQLQMLNNGNGELGGICKFVQFVESDSGVLG